MKSRLQLLTTLILSCLISTSFFGSCSSKDDPIPGEPLMEVTLRVEAKNGYTRADDNSGTQVGTDWENYINIDDEDYRIIFFDSQSNKCIAVFRPFDVTLEPEGNYVSYTLQGKVPSELLMYKDFKMMVLANWGKYPRIYYGMSIDDVCCPEQLANQNGGIFNAFSGADFQIGGTATPYIPMFGIKEYKNVTFGTNNGDTPTNLSGNINLLRAVAKVEIIFDTEDKYELLTDTDDEPLILYITKYNPTGFCAPEGITGEGSYYSNSNIVCGLHLPGGTNSPASTPMTMTQVSKRGGEGEEKTLDTFVAYIPEYRNVISSASDCMNSADASTATPEKAEIKLPLKGHPNATIKFATYSAGDPVAGQDFDIKRNHIYRFVITHVGDLKIELQAEPWNGVTHSEIVM